MPLLVLLPCGPLGLDGLGLGGLIPRGGGCTLVLDLGREALVVGVVPRIGIRVGAEFGRLGLATCSPSGPGLLGATGTSATTCLPASALAASMASTRALASSSSSGGSVASGTLASLAGGVSSEFTWLSSRFSGAGWLSSGATVVGSWDSG
jgi:hypothetical protein